MPWKDIGTLTRDLSRALERFNWPAVEEVICDRLIPRVRSEPEPLGGQWAKDILHKLRRKRRFHLMAQLADALIKSGVNIPQVRRQYAQALIDQGTLASLAAAEVFLQEIIQDPNRPPGEEMEARGLIGRIYKQRYVDNDDLKSPANRANLERALAEYYGVYRLAPETYLWHGINAVALTARARRDGFPPTELPDEQELARAILQTLKQREEAATEPLPAYDIATAMEARVALGDAENAAAEASRYLFSDGADAFELGSTVRQLTEVWQLEEDDPLGGLLLPICKAGYLSKEGASHFETDPKRIAGEAAAARKAVEALQSSEGGFETAFTPDAMVTLKWYRVGLETCDSIARIEKRNGTGKGTGWLVEAADFFPGRQGVLLLTNEHVISDVEEHERAIFPYSAQANFQATGQVIRVGEIVYSNTYRDLDATFVTLREEPKAKPLTLSEQPVRLPEPPPPPKEAPPPPRLYVIGYPNAGDLKISLQDNYLLGCNERMLHYRTPTEPGSSGSPVFDAENWEVVGLHHKGEKAMPRIDGKEGTYEANEGITIPIIQAATRALK